MVGNSFFIPAEFVCDAYFKPSGRSHGIAYNRKAVVPQGKFPYALSRIRSRTTLAILAINSPLVGLPLSGLMVLPK